MNGIIVDTLHNYLFGRTTILDSRQGKVKWFDSTTQYLAIPVEILLSTPKHSTFNIMIIGNNKCKHRQERLHHHSTVDKNIKPLLSAYTQQSSHSPAHRVLFPRNHNNRYWRPSTLLDMLRVIGRYRHLLDQTWYCPNNIRYLTGKSIKARCRGGYKVG